MAVTKTPSVTMSIAQHKISRSEYYGNHKHGKPKWPLRKPL